MGNFISWSVALLITFPFLAYILIYWSFMKFSKNKKRSVLLAVDLGALLLFFSIHYVSLTVFDYSILGYVAVVALLVFLLVGFINKRIGSFSLSKSMKRGWRLNGLLFLVGYLFLFNYGMIMRILS